MSSPGAEAGTLAGEALAAVPSAERTSAPADGSVRSVLERVRTTPSIRPAPPGAAGLRAAIAAARRGTGAPVLGGSSPGTIAAGASVERVTVEVRIGSRTEMVALGLDGGRLLVAASDGGGEGSPFAQAALAWLDAAVEGALEPEPARSLAPSAVSAVDGVRSASEDLLLAVARGGVRAGATPAVLDALARIAAEPRGAVPLVRSRWLARALGALEASDGDLVARLLVAGAPVPSGAPSDTAVDRTYLELGREPLPGDAGTTIERRHLCDLGSGELVLEERVLSDASASLGPCPRLCAVGYGELHAGVPRRIVVSQYTVVPDVPASDWDRVLGFSVPLAAAARSALAALAARGDAEPGALVLGAVVDDGGLADDAGTRYPIAPGDLAAAAASELLELARREPIRWVLGRFEPAGGKVGLVPLACGWRDGERWRHARLR